MNQRRQCHGSGLAPSVRYSHQARGKCRICGGWFSLSTRQRVWPHTYKVYQLHLSTMVAA